MTTEEDGNSLDGTPPERFAPELERRGATVIGVNCAVGPAPMLETIERMEAVTRLPLSAQPNAGKPRDVEGRNIYLCSPEYMASYARRFIAAQRADRRRLLRHDARAHPADQGGGRRRGARQERRHGFRSARGRIGRRRRQRAPVAREKKSALAREARGRARS